MWIRLSSEKYILHIFEMDKLLYFMQLTTVGIATDLQNCEYRIRVQVAMLTLSHLLFFLSLNFIAFFFFFFQG